MADAHKVDVHKVLSTQYAKVCQGKIRKVPLDLSPIKQQGKTAFLLKNVFTAKECQDLISKSSETGYGPALIHRGDSAAPAPGYRDGERVMIDDEKFAEKLFERIGHLLPQDMFNRPLIAINERLRFLKYGPGDQFKRHTDGAYSRPDGSAKTEVTLQIYLTTGTARHGGATTFFRTMRSLKSVPIKPEVGMVLVFEHEIVHEGSPVKVGTKYTIRMDVLYET